MAAIGRNELCPCGSGLKLKKCFLLKSPDEIENLMSAERLKRRVEAANPYQGNSRGFHLNVVSVPFEH